MNSVSNILKISRTIQISFTFNKGINVVIGENNNGKTALIDAIRIAFSCALYKKDIFFSKTDFHVNAAGKKATSAQIDVYLKDVPQNLIEIWDPIQPDCGEFHVVFTLEKTPSGTDKVMLCFPIGKGTFSSAKYSFFTTSTTAS